MKYLEVEQKFQVDDLEVLEDCLADLGAKAGPSTRQIDTYYNPPHRDFLAADVISEWLRIREENGGSSINYKRWLPLEAKIKTHCDEYETAVVDSEAIRRLLHALDFREIVTVDKTRQEWTVGSEIVVAFDTVVGAGRFVEFEFKGEATDVQETITRLEQFVRDLAVPLGNRINRGYPHMLLGREH